jgi:hypothetical protein
VSVAPFIASQLKPHQWDGVKFLWQAVMQAKRPETAQQPRRNDHGAVLAHSMGLGKTLTVIAFVHTALARARNERGVDYVQYADRPRMALGWPSDRHLKAIRCHLMPSDAHLMAF